MKPIIICLFFAFSSLYGKSQLYLGWEAGRSPLNFTVGLKAGVGIKSDWLIEGAIKTHTDQINPAYFTASAGYQFWLNDNIRLVPLAGYARWLVSNNYEKRNLNKNTFIGGLRLQMTKWYIEMNYTPNTPMFSIGFLTNRRGSPPLRN